MDGNRRQCGRVVDAYCWDHQTKSTHAKPITKPMQTTPWDMRWQIHTRSSNAKPRIQRGPKPHATTSETSDSWWMDDVRLFPNLFLSKQSLDKNAICQMSYIKATMPKCPSETSPQVDKHNLKTDSFYASLCCVLLCICLFCEHALRERNMKKCTLRSGKCHGLFPADIETRSREVVCEMQSQNRIATQQC